VLTPLTPGVGFRQLILYLNGAQLTGMEIQDNLDQSVVIKFTELDSDSPLSSADFAFTPPPGADLFYYDE
jgi:outer membrane lipoprotein-sorting protein